MGSRRSLARIVTPLLLHDEAETIATHEIWPSLHRSLAQSRLGHFPTSSRASHRDEIDTNRESSLTHHEPTVLPSFSTTERDASCRRDGSILCPRFGSYDPKERDQLGYLFGEQLCIFCPAEKVSERFTFFNQGSLGLPATNRRCNGCHARNALESGVNVFLSGRLTIAYF